MVSLLLLACSGSEDSKPPPVDTADADTDTDTDTDTDADTDTDTAKDSAVTIDTSDTDTGLPAIRIDTGYVGPPRIAMIVDGATGSATEPSTVVVYDPSDGTSNVIADVIVRGDSRIDCAGDAIFALESRSADGEEDRLVRVEPMAYTATEWTVGNNFQPRDVAAVGATFWVSNFAKNRVSVFNTDGTSGGFIDLTAYADSDGVPEAVGALAVGPKVYVALARQTGTTFNGAQVVEYDVEDVAFTNAVSLTGTYPSGKMLVVEDKLLVHLQSSDGAAADGGVESIDIASFSSGGLVVSDATASVTQTAAALDPFSNTLWAGVLNSSAAPQIASYSLNDGSALQTFVSDARVSGVGALDGTVWASVNPFDGSPGSLVGINPADGTHTTEVVLAGRVRAMSVCASGPPEDKVPPE